MRRALTTFIVLLFVLPVLFLLAGRPLAELVGLARASADETVDSIVERVPREVLDKKLDHDLSRRRQSVLDSQIHLNRSQRRLESLAQEVAELEESVGRRERLLAEAYPVLEEATHRNLAKVSFASAEHSLTDFQHDLDQLLAQQERERRELEIKRAGLARLEASVEEGERAIVEMGEALTGLEQEIAVLRARREQAGLEAETIDLVSTATGKGVVSDDSLARTADELRAQVDTLEAGNEARRAMIPQTAGMASRVERDWQRLEQLRAIHTSASEAAGTEAEIAEAHE